MSSNCCNSCCHCDPIVVVRVLPLLVVAGAIYGLIKLVAGLQLSLPAAATVPLSLVAALGTLWGLWLGTRIHGRGEPLMVGGFGLAMAGAGFVLSVPLALAGVFTVLTAALWSLALCTAKQREA
jgi:hypothetical protein